MNGASMDGYLMMPMPSLCSLSLLSDINLIQLLEQAVQLVESALPGVSVSKK
jgi:hypothetical protein